jgi:hypothetical protein
MPVRVKGMVRYLQGEPMPRCPFCMDAETRETFLPEYGDLETDEIECSHCGRAYKIVAHVSYAFDCCPRGFSPQDEEGSR